MKGKTIRNLRILPLQVDVVPTDFKSGLVLYR
jgi:hypothetical protein